jgi:hypothetical protein
MKGLPLLFGLALALATPYCEPRNAPPEAPPSIPDLPVPEPDGSLFSLLGDEPGDA